MIFSYAFAPRRFSSKHPPFEVCLDREWSCEKEDQSQPCPQTLHGVTCRASAAPTCTTPPARNRQDTGVAGACWTKTMGRPCSHTATSSNQHLAYFVRT